jgi:hypothetical protein
VAGIKGTGLDELYARTKELSKVLSGDALVAAYDAAAKVFRETIKNAAPVGKDPKNKSKKRAPHGELKGSVKVYKGKNNALTVGGSATKLGRVLIGPSKEHGFYGYFLAKGWKSPLGSAMIYWAKPGRWRPESWQIKTRRRLRPEKMQSGSHSQIGLSHWRDIPAPYPDWFEGATRAVEERAKKDGMEAFEEVIKKVI